jgi:hypothetical protein
MARKDLGKRPEPRRKPAIPSQADLAAAADRCRYVGSSKHVDGLSRWKDPGRAGVNAHTVEEARQDAPEPPYTMLCPTKWNTLNPAREATALLQDAVRRGQVSPFDKGGFPKFVYARDPDDSSIVYRAHLMSNLQPPGAYKAYPLTDGEIEDLEMPVS